MATISDLRAHLANYYKTLLDAEEERMARNLLTPRVLKRLKALGMDARQLFSAMGVSPLFYGLKLVSLPPGVAPSFPELDQQAIELTRVWMEEAGLKDWYER